MTSIPKEYLMILPVKYYRLNEDLVALESAFAEHLKSLKKNLFPSFNYIRIGMVEMSLEEYEQKKKGLLEIQEKREGLFFSTLYKSEMLNSRVHKFFNLFPIAHKTKNLVKNCTTLHTGLSSDVFFPVEFIAALWGVLFKKKIIFVVDIDFRNSARMNYETGTWSLKSYILCKYIYDKLRELQIKIAAEKFSLLLLKGEKLTQDFGRGKKWIKNFLDSAFSEENIITDIFLSQKLHELKEPQKPLELVYFGRLTPYKGIDYCIRAVAISCREHGRNIRFHIIGGGEQEEDLKSLAKEMQVEDIVVFHGMLPFNHLFVKKLYSYHLLLAAPLREDTPRSALDALAAGIPILAFDTYYYRDLKNTGAVVTVPWRSVDQLANKITYYEKNRDLLEEMVLRAVDFASQNSQEKWLARRLEWTHQYAE